MIKKFLLLGLLLVLICPLTTAALIISESNITSTSIRWEWDSTITLTNLSVDGYRVVLADYNQNNFVLSGLQANERHTIKIYSGIENGTLSSTTSKAPQDVATEILFGYIFFIAAIIAIIIGIKIPVIAWLGCGLSIIGIVDMITISFWAGFVFMCVFCAGVLVALSARSD